MTDTFTACCLRTRPADANDRGDTIYVRAVGAARFVFENGTWTAHASSWLCGGHPDPDGTALHWIAHHAAVQPLVFWSLHEAVEQAFALADQVDLMGDADPAEDLKAIRMAFGRSVIPSVDAYYPYARTMRQAAQGDDRNRELVGMMRNAKDLPLVTLHRSVIAEAELIGRLAIRALGRGAELD